MFVPEIHNRTVIDVKLEDIEKEDVANFNLWYYRPTNDSTRALSLYSIPGESLLLEIALPTSQTGENPFYKGFLLIDTKRLREELISLGSRKKGLNLCCSFSVHRNVFIYFMFFIPILFLYEKSKNHFKAKTSNFKDIFFLLYP